MALTDAMTAVGWQDGHGPSLKAATDKDVMARDEELKIITAKHAGSTTATTQAMDVGAQFKNIKQHNKTTSSTDLPDNVGLKGRFNQKLDLLTKNGILNLPLKVRKPLIDHVGSAPEIMTRSTSKKFLKKSFVENGMADAHTGYWPDMHKVVKTCKRILTKEEEELVTSSFAELYKVTMDNGHIWEDVFDVSTYSLFSPSPYISSFVTILSPS